MHGLQGPSGQAGTKNDVFQVTNQVHARVAEELGAVAHHKCHEADESLKGSTSKQ